MEKRIHKYQARGKGGGGISMKNPMDDLTPIYIPSGDVIFFPHPVEHKYLIDVPINGREMSLIADGKILCGQPYSDSDTATVRS